MATPSKRLGRSHRPADGTSSHSRGVRGFKGAPMKFPNLVYAISLRRQTHYEIAQAVGMSEWRFSRLLNGRSEFTPIEREHVARTLNFDESWLFQKVMPPARAHADSGVIAA